MDKEKKDRYGEFVYKFINSKKICMTTKLKQKFGEDFFDQAVKDGILIEIEKNDVGQRQFLFTEYAKKVLE